MNSLGNMPEEQRAVALERFRIMRPAIEDSVPLVQIAQEANMSSRTAQRWMAAYKQEGLTGLAKCPRGDRGHCHKLPLQLEKVIEGLALKKPKPSMASVQRQAAEISTRYGWPEPTYRQVRGIIGRLDPALASLAHEGAAGYKQVHDLIHRHEASGPNELWQADHTLLDVWIKDEKGTARRPWLTIILDDFSRAVAGYYLAFDAPSASGTSLALRQAIWRKEEPGWPICGIPSLLYTDNGADFISIHMEQVAADIRMRLVFSIPGQPRGKGKVERFFGTVNQMFLSDLPGYVPNGVPARGEKVQPTLTLGILDQRFRAWLLGPYHRREHGQTRETPVERWTAGGFLPRMPQALEQLDLLLLTVAKSRRVRKDGIHFEGFRYVSTILGAYIGEDVMIRYDPRDLGEIRVYLDGKFLCRAISPELSGETVSLKEIKSARNRQRRELRKKILDRRALAQELLSFHHLEDEAEVPAEPEELPGRADGEADAKDDEPPLKRYRSE